MRTYLLTTAAILAFPAIAPSMALAQTAPAADYAFEDDIVVTAQKREQSLQDVPLSITAISGDQLSQRGINDVSTLNTSVPGLNFGQSGTDARPAIRGVRTEEVDAANDPTIGFFVDSIYKPRTSQALAAFVDLERVEVLRGPQGTLFGRNTYGGSINLISRLPDDAFGGSGSIRYASFNDIRLEGVINVPLGTSTALRVVGMWQQSDGFVNVLPSRTPTGGQAEDFNDNDQWYVRGTLRHDFTDDVQLIVRASHWAQDGTGAGGFGYANVGTLRATQGATPGTATGIQDLGGFLDRNNTRTGATPGPSDQDPYNVYRNTDFTRETRETTVNAELSATLGPIRFKSITGYADFTSYRQSDEDFSETFGTLLELETGSESFSQEIQFLSEYESPLQWIAGFYYFNEKVVEDFFFRNPVNPNAFTFRQDVKTDSLAAFGQADWKVADNITIVLGGRYTWDIKRFVYESPVGAPDLRPDKAEFAKFTWRAGVNIDLTPDNLLYASVSTGFRSGGFNNGGNPPVPSYGPQTVTAYEAGIKNSFRSAGITLNLAGFYNDYNDILANTFVDIPGTTTTVVARSNAGESRAYGLEAEFTWRPVEGLLIDANGTWLNARFDSFSATRPLAQATGFTLVPGTTNQLNLSGNKIPLSPEFTVSLGTSYRFDLGSAGSITPNARFFWSDSYFVNEFNYDAGIDGRDVGKQSSYTRTDLSLTWMSEGDRFMMQGFVQNLEDKAILNRSVIGGQGAIFQNFAPPRIFGIKGGFNF